MDQIGNQNSNNILAKTGRYGKLGLVMQELRKSEFLWKIDHKFWLNFKETESVNISLLLHRHLNNYEELFHAKEISITKNINEGIFLTMNETLAEILIVNLLINAIKHNIEKGSITIELNKKFISIANTGKILNDNPAIGYLWDFSYKYRFLNDLSFLHLSQL